MSAEEFMCVKHGTYKLGLDKTGAHHSCPKCQDVKSRELCVECELHKGTIDFTESTMHFIHGFRLQICRCCYFKKVEEAYKNVLNNYEKLKREIKDYGCH